MTLDRWLAGCIPVESLDTLLASRRTFLAFLQKRTGSREDAEEILQSAFARAPGPRTSTP